MVETVKYKKGQDLTFALAEKFDLLSHYHTNTI